MSNSIWWNSSLKTKIKVQNEINVMIMKNNSIWAFLLGKQFYRLHIYKLNSEYVLKLLLKQIGKLTSVVV